MKKKKLNKKQKVGIIWMSVITIIFVGTLILISL